MKWQKNFFHSTSGSIWLLINFWTFSVAKIRRLRVSSAAWSGWCSWCQPSSASSPGESAIGTRSTTRRSSPSRPSIRTSTRLRSSSPGLDQLGPRAEVWSSSPSGSDRSGPKTLRKSRLRSDSDWRRLSSPLFGFCSSSEWHCSWGNCKFKLGFT